MLKNSLNVISVVRSKLKNFVPVSVHLVEWCGQTRCSFVFAPEALPATGEQLLHLHPAGEIIFRGVEGKTNGILDFD